MAPLSPASEQSAAADASPYAPTVHRVVCMRLGALGDVVFALHALRLLRKERPDLRIAWVVEDRFAGLLQGHPDVDELFVAPRKRWEKLLRPSASLVDLGRDVHDFIVRVRASRPEATLDFQGNLRSGLLIGGIAAPIRIGYGRGASRECNWLFQTVRVPTPRTHRVARDLSLLTPLGVAPRYERPLLPVSDFDRRTVQTQIAAIIAPGRPLAVIHAGTSAFGAIKQWDSDRFAAVADRLIGWAGCEVVLSWGPGERETAQRVLDRMRQRGHLSPPTRTIGQLIALLSMADLVIACDTGPLHLAAALGRPVVGLYGPKAPAIYGPVGTRGKIVRGVAGCSPCARRRCGHLSCMQGISVDAVWGATRAVLNGAGDDLALKTNDECRTRVN